MGWLTKIKRIIHLLRDYFIGNINNLLIEIVAIYFIIAAASAFVVVIFAVVNGCFARNRSIPSPFAFILKSTVPSSLLCRECDDQTAKSKVHRKPAFKHSTSARLQALLCDYCASWLLCCSSFARPPPSAFSNPSCTPFLMCRECQQ